MKNSKILKRVINKKNILSCNNDEDAYYERKRKHISKLG